MRQCSHSTDLCVAALLASCLHSHQKSPISLTAGIGRGRFQPPLQPTTSGCHSWATVCPLTDGTLSHYSEDLNTVRALYASCNALARRAARGPRITDSAAPLIQLFNQPLAAPLRVCNTNLYQAARAEVTEVADGLGDEGAAYEDSALGLSTPWVAEHSLMREMWCKAPGEMQIQLLSFTVASRLLSTDDKLAALTCTDTYSRLAPTLIALREFERRLAAELALQAWARDPETGAV